MAKWWIHAAAEHACSRVSTNRAVARLFFNWLLAKLMMAYHGVSAVVSVDLLPFFRESIRLTTRQGGFLGASMHELASHTE